MKVSCVITVSPKPVNDLRGETIQKGQELL